MKQQQNLAQPLVDPLSGGQSSKPGRIDPWNSSGPADGPYDDDDEGGGAVGLPSVVDAGDDMPDGESSLKATIFNLINTVIGAGLLALPQAVQQNGIVVGAGLILVVGYLSDFTISMILYAADYARESNFGRITEVRTMVPGRALHSLTSAMWSKGCGSCDCQNLAARILSPAAHKAPPNLCHFYSCPSSSRAQPVMTLTPPSSPPPPPLPSVPSPSVSSMCTGADQQDHEVLRGHHRVPAQLRPVHLVLHHHRHQPAVLRAGCWCQAWLRLAELPAAAGHGGAGE